MKNLRKPYAFVSLLTAAIITSSCQMMATSEADEADWFCFAFLPIKWSVNDTAETIVDVKKHNAVWTSLCDKETVSQLE